MNISNNKIVCDLKKVQWASLSWANGKGATRIDRPGYPTVNGEGFNTQSPVFGSQETMLAYAQRIGILDVWTPVVRLQFSSNHSLKYTGDKAKAIYDAWCAMIFSKKKGKK